MAITVTQNNPIKVTGTNSSAEAVYTGRESIYIKRIYWYLATTATHKLSVKDKNGRQIAIMNCETNGTSQVLDIEMNVDDIYIDDMDSGEVYFYVK